MVGQLVLFRTLNGHVSGSHSSTAVSGIWLDHYVAGDPEDHPVPLHRTLLHVHDLGQSKSTLRQAGSKTMLWAVSAINCRPAGTAPKQSNQRRASSLSSTTDGRMAQVPPRLPFGMPIGGPSWRQHRPPRARKPVPRTADPPSCRKLYCFRASFKLERARSSAPQLSRACNDIKQADCMRWLGENHDSTALSKAVQRRYATIRGTIERPPEAH
jgi:hypothetical protein